MANSKKVYKFKKGQVTVLDNIYAIQGLGGGDWWEKTGNDISSSKSYEIELGDEVVITRDIEITIIIKAA